MVCTPAQSGVIPYCASRMVASRIVASRMVASRMVASRTVAMGEFWCALNYGALVLVE